MTSFVSLFIVIVLSFSFHYLCPFFFYCFNKGHLSTHSISIKASYFFLIESHLSVWDGIISLLSIELDARGSVLLVLTIFWADCNDLIKLKTLHITLFYKILFSYITKFIHKWTSTKHLLKSNNWKIVKIWVVFTILFYTGSAVCQNTLLKYVYYYPLIDPIQYIYKYITGVDAIRQWGFSWCRGILDVYA